MKELMNYQMRRGLILLLLVLALLAGFGLWQWHPFVSMSNDHAGRSVLPTPAPGDRALTGGVKLGNDGLLPYTYTVRVSEADPAAKLVVQRYPDGQTLYSGPEPASPVVLGNLAPGEQVTLKLSVTSSQDIVSPTFVWEARGSAPASAWSWTGWPLVLLLALLNALMLGAWLRELARNRRRGDAAALDHP